VRTVRLTAAQAIVRFLIAQRTELDGEYGFSCIGYEIAGGRVRGWPGRRARPSASSGTAST
jgi:TPP-dependent trihydroxycyclohexane-1,2-dione (THcHDO) dehydratase